MDCTSEPAWYWGTCDSLLVLTIMKNPSQHMSFQLEDCALQLYKYNGNQGDYGTYLDLESNLEEQWDDLEGFQEK